MNKISQNFFFPKNVQTNPHTEKKQEENRKEVVWVDKIF